MKNQPSFLLLVLQKKYHKLYSRLLKAISTGRLAHFSATKKRQLLQCLSRYEKQLKHWGIAAVTSAALLLPADIWAQLVPVGSEFQINTYITNQQYDQSVAMDSDGDFVIVWDSYGQDGNMDGIYAQRYNNAGVAQGSEFRVNTFTTNQQLLPSVAMDSDGDFVIVWESRGGQDGSNSGIYAQRYNNVGVAQGGEFRVNTYTTNEQSLPSVAMDSDGDFVVIWRRHGQVDSPGIYAQRYNYAGLAQDVEFKVNTGDIPSVAMDSDGDFVITWHDNQDGSSNGILAQRYNSVGLPQGSEFQVNTYTTGEQVAPWVSIDNDGDFVIAWTSNGQDGSQWGIYAQRFNSSGIAQDGEFRVNAYTTNEQQSASVAMDSDGDFIVAWESDVQDGSGNGDYAKHYNSVGVQQGSEFRVNTYTTNQQRHPTVAMEGGGDFVVAWHSLGQDGSQYGIYAQRYCAPQNWYPDNDSDGYGSGAPISACDSPPNTVANNTDCNDNNMAINPGAIEICNDLDDDCDGFIDTNDPDVLVATWYQDNDGDGKGNPTVSQTACAQLVGYVSNNLDCDDNNAAACPVPSAPNTTGITDVSGLASWTGTSCAQRYNIQYKRKVDVVWNYFTLGSSSSNYTLNNLQQGTKYQWRVSTVCDTVSNINSQLTAVQNFTTKYRVYTDSDLDGYGNNASSGILVATFPQSGYSLNNLDCNDSNFGINPGLPEICNNTMDDDCDGLTDASDPDIVVLTWYQDNDGDGKGNPAVSQAACSQPIGYVSNNLDCDDSNVAVCPMPTAPLTSTITDVSTMLSWTGTSCAQQYRLQYKRKVDVNWIYLNVSANTSTYILNNLLPGTKYQWRVSTVCDSISNVVSSPIPAQNFTTKYRVYQDVDGDGYGNSVSVPVFVNTLPAPGYSTNNLDCLDTNSAVFPGAAEICNLIDDNCDGLYDEGFPTVTYYRDLDNDGYGNVGVTIQTCTVPMGYVSNSNDCNDANSNIRPNAPEICNGGVDDDCDLLADDFDPGVTGQTTWYIDNDGDGLGSTATTIFSCVPPVGYVSNTLDCNDNSSSPFCLAPSGLNITAITSSSATLSWVNSPCVSYYAVQYRPNAMGSWLPASPFLINGNSQLFTALVPNTLYQYRIRALCNAINTNTPFITGTFTTLPLPMALSTFGGLGTDYIDFELYPNPGDGVFNLRLESGTDETATVTVLDGLGKLVFNSAWSITKGLNVNQFDLSSMANGVYQVQVGYGDMVKSKKMVIVR
jgi:hypothetical protein